MKTVLLLIGLIFMQTGSAQHEKSKKRFEKNFKSYQFITNTAVDGDSSMSESEAFYMFDHEITNLEYKEFLYHVKKNEGAKAHANLCPDTTLWIKFYPTAYCEPMTNMYFWHPAYNAYPVVNITHEQALAYCEWITNIFNNAEKPHFKKVKFRLPSTKEWEHAAHGDLESSPFPWGGPYLRNSKGCYLANFCRVPETEICRDEKGKLVICENEKSSLQVEFNSDGSFFTAPSKSYIPNGFGLYNMSGNVAEFVTEKGVSKGGSWHDPGHYLMINESKKYDPEKSASPERGFRILMEVIEY